MPATQRRRTVARSGEPFARPAPVRGRARRQSGFTVVELFVAIAILAVMTAIAVRAYDGYRDRSQSSHAATQIAVISALVDQYRNERGTFPATLADIGEHDRRDPWGNPYQYVSHADGKGKGQWRKDHNIVPINSDYDLWSMGKDGTSSPPLTASASRDDIVRANNGRFVGLASQYDP